MKFSLATELPVSAAWLLEQLALTRSFRHVSAPLIRFTPVNGPWPRHWEPGMQLELRMAWLGWLPLGRQTVRITQPQTEEAGAAMICDDGSGQLMRRWHHRITVQSLGAQRCLYRDQVELQARWLPALMTLPSALMARMFFAHRQRRWRALARAHAADPAPLFDPLRRKDVFEALVRASAQAAITQSWSLLAAAHVVGQTSLPLHLRAHWAMLVLAWQTRDGREVLGQLARLALVVPGHLLRRLPAGNTGRANVSAFSPMALDADTVRRIREAAAASALAATD